MSLPSLSLATFVKNEEKCIRGMIESVWTIVDEIIVVDTGSTDRTVEIAKPYATKLIHRPFTNFGDIRTFTLKQASCDWILMLDADERILEEDLDTLQGLLTVEGLDAWALPRHQWDNLENLPNAPETQAIEDRVYPDYQTRLFKNTPEMKYVNQVHESLTGYKKRGLLQPPCPHIHHYQKAFKTHREIHHRYQLYAELSKGK